MSFLLFWTPYFKYNRLGFLFNVNFIFMVLGYFFTIISSLLYLELRNHICV